MCIRDRIKAVKKGTAKITVKSVANKNKKATLKVIVGKPVTKVKLDQTKVTAYAGDTVKLKATLSPSKPSVKKLKYRHLKKEEIDEKIGRNHIMSKNVNKKMRKSLKCTKMLF